MHLHGVVSTKHSTEIVGRFDRGIANVFEMQTVLCCIFNCVQSVLREYGGATTSTTAFILTMLTSAAKERNGNACDKEKLSVLILQALFGVQ